MTRTTAPRSSLLAALTALSLIVTGCYDDSLLTSSAPHDEANARAQAAETLQDHEAAMLARGFAMALTDDELRQQILRDLRDSPFPRRTIHLTSYLRGPRGAPVVEAAAGGLGLTPDSFIALTHRGSLKLFMPRVLDRVSWTGTLDVLVFGTARPPEEFAADSTPGVAFTAAGDTALFDPYLGPKVPLLALVPISDRDQFGPDPEETRRTAPTGQGATISTSPEEVEELKRLSGLGDLTGYSHRGSVGAYGVNAAKSWDECTSSSIVDEDQNGFDDECEYELARLFQPVLVVHLKDGLMGREPYYGVRISQDEDYAVEIFYLMAYYADGTHKGDSEFISLAVSYTYEYGWAVSWGLYSAHFNTTFTDRTAYYPYNDLQFRGGIAPLSYVALWKHANYNSYSNCNEYQDLCASTDSGSLVDLGVNWLPEHYSIANNIGGNAILKNCVYSYIGNKQGMRECMWKGDTFAGWYPDEDGVTGYGVILNHFGWTFTEPATTFSVSIDGPTYIDNTVDDGPYVWEAVPSGGSGAYTYEWQRRTNHGSVRKFL